MATVRFCFVTRNVTSIDRSRGVHTSITIIVNKYPINLCLQIYSSSNDLRKQSFRSDCNSRGSLGRNEKRSTKKQRRDKGNRLCFDHCYCASLYRRTLLLARNYFSSFYFICFICDSSLAHDLYSGRSRNNRLAL